MGGKIPCVNTELGLGMRLLREGRGIAQSIALVEFDRVTNSCVDLWVKWSRLFGQIFRFDEWIVCRG